MSFLEYLWLWILRLQQGFRRAPGLTRSGSAKRMPKPQRRVGVKARGTSTLHGRGIKQSDISQETRTQTEQTLQAKKTFLCNPSRQLTYRKSRRREKTRFLGTYHCARQQAKSFTYMTSFNSLRILKNMYHYIHYKNLKKTEAKKKQVTWFRSNN